MVIDKSLEIKEEFINYLKQKINELFKQKISYGNAMYELGLKHGREEIKT